MEPILERGTVEVAVRTGGHLNKDRLSGCILEIKIRINGLPIKGLAVAMLETTPRAATM